VKKQYCIKYITQFERKRSIKENDMIDKSIIYMQNHIDKRTTLADMAGHSSLSVSQFSLTLKLFIPSFPVERTMVIGNSVNTTCLPDDPHT